MINMENNYFIRCSIRDREKVASRELNGDRVFYREGQEVQGTRLACVFSLEPG